MNVAEVFNSNSKLKLSESLHKRHPLNITYRTSQLGEREREGEGEGEGEGERGRERESKRGREERGRGEYEVSKGVICSQQYFYKALTSMTQTSGG